MIIVIGIIYVVAVSIFVIVIIGFVIVTVRSSCIRHFAFLVLLYPKPDVVCGFGGCGCVYVDVNVLVDVDACIYNERTHAKMQPDINSKVKTERGGRHDADAARVLMFAIFI